MYFESVFIKAEVNRNVETREKQIRFFFWPQSSSPFASHAISTFFFIPLPEEEIKRGEREKMTTSEEERGQIEKGFNRPSFLLLSHPFHPITLAVEK